jgi:hypothetical protein
LRSRTPSYVVLRRGSPSDAPGDPSFLQPARFITHMNWLLDPQHDSVDLGRILLTILSRGRQLSGSEHPLDYISLRKGNVHTACAFQTTQEPPFGIKSPLGLYEDISRLRIGRDETAISNPSTNESTFSQTNPHKAPCYVRGRKVPR